MEESLQARLDIKKTLSNLPMPTLIIGALWVSILIFGAYKEFSIAVLLSDTIRRFGMWGLLVLAMVPSIQSGTGPNFALPVGICSGLLALVCSIEFGFTGIMWFIVAVILAILFGGVLGVLYGILMNAVKGSEMIIATYSGFSITYFFCILWMSLPFRSPIMGWMLGSGLRNTIELRQLGSAQILNDFLQFEIFGVSIPTGMLLVFFACCILVWLFFRSKMGIAISAVGANPMFAKASGLNVDECRIIANVISTIFGAVGIIVFAQSFGFASLYDAPMWMAFTAAAAVLIGGATAQRSKIIHVIIGTLIFQGLLTNAPPVLNSLLPDTDLSEVIRMVVQNGIILYALTKVNRA